MTLPYAQRRARTIFIHLHKQCGRLLLFTAIAASCLLARQFNRNDETTNMVATKTSGVATLIAIIIAAGNADGNCEYSSGGGKGCLRGVEVCTGFPALLFYGAKPYDEFVRLRHRIRIYYTIRTNARVPFESMFAN